MYAARTVGQGHAGLKTCGGMLNLPKPMTNNNLDLIASAFSVAAKKVAEKSMLDAVNELSFDGDSVADIGVAVEQDKEKSQSVDRRSYRQTAKLFWYGLACKYWWPRAEKG